MNGDKAIFYFSDIPEVKFETDAACIEHDQCSYRVFMQNGDISKPIKDYIMIDDICSIFKRTVQKGRNDDYGIIDRGETAAFDEVEATKYTLENDFGSLVLLSLKFQSTSPELNWGFWDSDSSGGNFATLDVTRKQVWTEWSK